MPDVSYPDLADLQYGDLSVRQLYLQLASARAATIQQVLWQTKGLPEPPAETLTLAAAGLAHVAGLTRFGVGETARAAGVARRLTAEAKRHDRKAGLLAERALDELEGAFLQETRVGIVRETADSLAWACAVLRHTGERLETTDEGNADQLELAWMCLIEAADLLAAADRASRAQSAREA